jgi:hypothetical protein
MHRPGIEPGAGRHWNRKLDSQMATANFTTKPPMLRVVNTIIDRIHNVTIVTLIFTPDKHCRLCRGSTMMKVRR